MSSLYLFRNPDPSSPPILSGRTLAQKDLPPLQLAALCAQSLSHGELTYHPTLKQQAANFGAPVAYVQLMLRLTPQKRARIANGQDKASYVGLVRALREVDAAIAEALREKDFGSESYRFAWEKAHRVFMNFTR
jgi:hypothetical protein